MFFFSYPNTKTDYSNTGLELKFISIPTFQVGLLLTLLRGRGKLQQVPKGDNKQAPCTQIKSVKVTFKDPVDVHEEGQRKRRPNSSHLNFYRCPDPLSLSPYTHPSSKSSGGGAVPAANTRY